jgi:Secretion system C-terminal sorting domain
MKKIQFTAMALLMASASFAQTAADFTATDCNSVSHTLYSELNAGKCVVIEWIMPCSACIGGATAAYTAVQNKLATYPGKLVNYLVDDDGGTTCSALSSWATTNSMDITKMTVFGNSGMAINEANYGGSGMPHVIVIGPNKTIYFNQKNGASNNLVGITSAIDLALAPTSVENVSNGLSINLYPNPAKCETNLSFSLATATTVQVQLLDITGKVVGEIFNGQATQGENNIAINTAKYRAGAYTIKLTSSEGMVTKKLVITE